MSHSTCSAVRASAGTRCSPRSLSTYGPWSFGVWCSDPLTNSDKVEGQSDPEIDPSGSYTFTINDTTNLQPGFTWYTYLRAPTDQGFYRETFEPNLALNYTVVGVTLTPKVYYDVVLQGPTYEMNAAYTVPLKDLGTEIDLVGSAGTFLQTDVANQASPKVKAWGNYWLIGFTSPFQITKSGQLIVGWSLTEGNSSYTQAGFRAEGAQPRGGQPRLCHGQLRLDLLISRRRLRCPHLLRPHPVRRGRAVFLCNRADCEGFGRNSAYRARPRWVTPPRSTRPNRPKQLIYRS